MLTQAFNLFTNIWYSIQQKFNDNTYILIYIYMFNTTLDQYSGLPANQLWGVLTYITLWHLWCQEFRIFRNFKITQRTKLKMWTNFRNKAMKIMTL